MLPVSRTRSLSKGKKRRLRLAALGLILLGLWGMLALLLGASVGKEVRYRADLKADLQPGFGETHAAPHPLGAPFPVEEFSDGNLPPVCLDKDCPGTARVADAALPDRPVDDGTDDATSSIGRGSTSSPTPGGPALNFARGGSPGFPSSLFIPGGLSGGNPNPGRTENPKGDNPNPPDNFRPPDNPPQNDLPPLDFTPPFLNPPGPDTPGPEGPGIPEFHGPGPGSDGPGPHGPDGPPGGRPDQPQQIPEPLTLSLFAAGVTGLTLLRRRRSSK